jgi:hypothetical protein
MVDEKIWNSSKEKWNVYSMKKLGDEKWTKDDKREFDLKTTTTCCEATAGETQLVVQRAEPQRRESSHQSVQSNQPGLMKWIFDQMR